MFMGSNESGEENIQSFTEKNIFYLILSVFVILIMFYIYNIVNFYKKQPIQKIEPSYQIHSIYDSNEPTIVENKNLDCPMNDSKFSFTLFLNIDDFYCNRGFWKCIFIKGQEINDTISKCNVPITNTEGKSIKDLTNLQKLKCDFYGNPQNKLTAISQDLLKIRGNKIIYDEEYPNRKITFEELDLTNESDKGKRIDLICKILDEQDDNIIHKKNLLKCLASNHKLFKTKYDPSVVEKILSSHKSYCDNVYAINKKVRKDSDPEVRLLDKKDNKRYLDDYDNICSQDNLEDKYDYLLPKNLDEIQENKLINLSKENNLEIYNPNPDNENLEGIYFIPAEELVKEVKYGSMTFYNFFSRQGDYTSSFSDEEEKKPLNNKFIFYTKHPGGNYTQFTIIKTSNKYGYFTVTDEQEIQKIAREHGFNYYTKLFTNPNQNNGTFIYTLLNFKKLDHLHKYKNKTHKDFKNEDVTQINGNYLEIKRVNNLIKYSMDSCWENLTSKFQFQSPGVWLHPYTNNLRICLTTYSSKDYDEEINDIIHPHKLTNTNYYISKISDNKKSPENEYHASTDDVTNTICPKLNKDKIQKNNIYLEYFDINNIPIKETFHLGLVLNENIVETYINGNMIDSTKLFGTIRYSNGTLQINTGNNGETKKGIKKINLGGLISDFKYFPYALNQNNIYNILNEKSDSIKLEPTYISSNEHNHTIELSHEHSFDTDTEQEHRHSVDHNDLKQEFYLDN